MLKNINFHKWRNVIPSAFSSQDAFNLNCPIDRNWNQCERRVLLVLEHVDTEDLRTHRMLTGPSGHWLRASVDLGLEYSANTRLKNTAFAVINFNFFKTYDLDTSDQASALVLCAQRVLAFAARSKATDVIVFGDQASVSLLREHPALSDRVQDEKRTLMLRGRPQLLDGVYWTGTLSLSAAYQGKRAGEDDEESDTQVDYANLLGFVGRCVGNALGRKLVHSFDMQPVVVQVNTIEKFKRLYRQLMACDRVAVDTETTGLGRVVNRLLTIQFAFDGNKGYVLPVDHSDATWTASERRLIEKGLRNFFTRKFDPLDTRYDRYLIGQNLKFDLTIIRQRLQIHAIQWRVWDLMAGEFSIDENTKSSSKSRTPGSGRVSTYTLEWMCAWYGCDFYHTAVFSKGDRATIEQRSLDEPGLLEYCVADVQVCWHIHDAQHARAQRVIIKGQPYTDRFHKFVVVQMNSLVQIESHMEHRGDQLDMPWLLKLKDTNGPISSVRRELLTDFKKLPNVIEANAELVKREGLPAQSMWGGDNWIFSHTKPEHKRQLFLNTMGLEPLSYSKKGEKNASLDKAFQEHYAKHPEIDIFTQLSQLGTLKGTYVDGFYNKLKTDVDMRHDYCLRASYGFTGTVTGRSNSFDPNLQNIPARGKFSKLIKRMFVAPRGCLTIKMDYCVDGDTYIPTKNGLVRLHTLVDKSGQPSDFILKTSSLHKPGSIVSAVYKGKKPVLRLGTDIGYSVKVTPEHKMLVLRGGNLIWVKAQDCKKHDLMCISDVGCSRDKKLAIILSDPNQLQKNNTSGHTNIYRYTEYKKYLVKIKIPMKRGLYHTEKFFTLDAAIKYRDKFYKKLGLRVNRSFTQITKPTHMTSDLAWLLGAIVSEGWMHRDHLFFGNTDLKFLKAYQKRMQSVFGIACTLDLKRTAGTYIFRKGVKYKANFDQYLIRIRSSQLVTWLQELGVYLSDGTWSIQPSKIKTIPDCVMNSDKESQLAFLSAYLEGDGSIGKNTIQYASTSRTLLCQIQLILNSHGIKSALKCLNKNTAVVLVNTEGTQHLWKGLKKYALSKKLLGLPVRTERLGRVPTDVWNQMTSAQKRSYSAANCYVSALTTKRKEGSSDVYDVTMRDQRRPVFVANGFLVHNCAHEIRMWGIISGDRHLCGLFMNGRWLRQRFRKTGKAIYKTLMETQGDVHKVNCEYLFNVPAAKVSKEQRNSVKSVVFGAIYGRGANAISNQTGQTVDDIKKLLVKFFARFVKADAWLKQAKEHSVKHGYMYSPIWRVRNMYTHLYGMDSFRAATERRGCNAPIQGFAADFGHTAAYLYELHIERVVRKFKLDDDPRLVSGVNTFVHDAIKTSAPYKYLLVCLQVLQWCATIGGMEFYKKHWGIRFPVEVEIDMDIAAHDETHYKWSWNEGNDITKDKDEIIGGGLRYCIRRALEDQLAIYPDIDVDAVEKQIWRVRENKPLCKYLDQHYPVLADWPDSIHIDVNSDSFKNGLLKLIKEPTNGK